MLSKKSFGGNKQNFLKLLMRFVRSDVRDHIVSQKNDHGPSCRHYRASQRRSSPKIPICEIFAVVRLSTFRQHRSNSDLTVPKSYFRSTPRNGHALERQLCAISCPSRVIARRKMARSHRATRWVGWRRISHACTSSQRRLWTLG
jgi:hypothetical protein